MDPWSGAVEDGCVWGRGAPDMKGHVAAAATAIATLAREGFEPAGDLVFAATADEEVGVDVGLSWLCKACISSGAHGLLRERGRRRARARRRAAGLPVHDRREDELAVPAEGARAQRPRLDAGDRGQRPCARPASSSAPQRSGRRRG